MGLIVENLTFGYRCFPVLKGVDFSVEMGNLVCMLGKNGAGKSTLFRCVLGLLKGYHGKIMADGVDLRTLKEKELARKIAYIPQNHDQAFAFSVLDMVMMGTTSSIQGLKSPGREQREAAFDALKTMRIGGDGGALIRAFKRRGTAAGADSQGDRTAGWNSYYG